jgi:uncharacterized delta-60 repeat protein
MFTQRPHRLVAGSCARTRGASFRPQLELLEPRTMLNAGALDPSFARSGLTTFHIQGTSVLTNFDGRIVLQPDGKILQIGNFSGNFALVRYDADGNPDFAFGNGGVVAQMHDEAYNLTLQPDGKILVAGGLNSYNLYRYNPNGTPDMTFGNNGEAIISPGGVSSQASASAVVVEPNGRIVLAGSYGYLPGPGMTPTGGCNIVGLTPSGPLDPTFARTDVPATQLQMTLDGRIFTGYGRIFAQGGVDPTYFYFSPTGSTGIYDLQPDGRIVVLTPPYRPNPHPTLQAARVNVNANRDPTFGPPNTNPAYDGTTSVTFPGNGPETATLAGEPDGRIVVAAGVAATQTLELARLNPNGFLDTSYGNNGETVITPLSSGQSPTVITALVQPDGKTLVAGTLTSASGYDLFVARFLGDLPAPTAGQRLVSQLYLDLLQRPADSGGLAFWSGLIDSGQATRTQVAQMLVGSTEYHHVVVEQVYGEYLHRPAFEDSAAFPSWDAFFAAGGSIDQMRALVLGSQEYYNLAGGTNDAFVAAVYRDVLGRPVDSVGQQAWDQDLTNGLPPSALAAAIMRSAEGNADEVQGLYHWLLHRAADPTGLQAFTSDLAQGMSQEQIVAILAGSPEYAATRT